MLCGNFCLIAVDCVVRSVKSSLTEYSTVGVKKKKKKKRAKGDAKLLSLATPPPRFEGHQGDDFDTWLERFEACCQVHAPASDGKLKCFSTLLGNDTFPIYRELKQKVKDGEYDNVVKAFKEAYSSPFLVEAFRSAPSVRNRRPGENLAVYAGELKRLARRAYPKYEK